MLPKNILKKTGLTAIGEGLSVRQHTTIMASVIAFSGGDISDFTFFSSSEFRVAEEVVTKGGKKITQHITGFVKFSLLPIILHFDGKILKEFTNGKDYQIDRLIVSIRVGGQTEVSHFNSCTETS